MKAAWMDAVIEAEMWRDKEKERGKPFTIKDGWSTPICVFAPTADRHMTERFGPKWKQDNRLLYLYWKTYPEFRCSHSYWWKKK